MARVLGPRNPVMPAFINIGQRLEGIGENEEIKAFTTAGFFGSEFGPMNLPFPEEAARAVQPPKGMDPGRFSSRYSFFKNLFVIPLLAITSVTITKSQCFAVLTMHIDF